MSQQKSQIRTLLELLPRVWPCWKVILIVSTVAGLLLGLLGYSMFHVSYASEVVLLIRPQRTFEEFVGQIRLDEEVVFAPKPITSFLPNPLSVEDYVLILESDDVMRQVADAFHERHGSEYPRHAIPKRAALGRMLSATSRLALKTPYDVKYFSTVLLRAEAPTPAMAHQLMTVWLELGQQRMHDLTYSAQVEKAYAAVEDEYQKRLAGLRDLDRRRIELRTTNADRLLALQAEWTGKELAYEAETRRLLSEAHASKPATDDPGHDLAIETLESERERGLETITLQAEAALDNLNHECEILQDQLTREFEVQLQTVQDLAASRLLANLIVARTSDEFTVLSKPTFPEEHDKPNVLIFILGAFILALIAGTFLSVVYLLARDIITRPTPNAPAP